MSNPPLSFAQMADHVAEAGGGSFDWKTHQIAEGPGFMAAFGGKERVVKEVTAEALKDYSDKFDEVGSNTPGAHLGAWGNTLDISRKIDEGSEARDFSTVEGQEAAFALPGTKIRGEQEAGKEFGSEYGANVLMNIDHPKGEDVDPNWNKQENPNEFSNWEAENPDWDKPFGTLDGKEITLGEHLAYINKLNTKALRKQSKPRRLAAKRNREKRNG